jgi:hypothetical protein
MSVEERVEGVEEFLLRPFLAREELNVVDEQHISLPIAVAEFDELAVLDRVDELVREALAGRVETFVFLRPAM